MCLSGCSNKRFICTYFNIDDHKRKYWVSFVIFFCIIGIVVAVTVRDILLNREETKMKDKHFMELKLTTTKEFLNEIQEYIDNNNDFIDNLKKLRKIKTFAQNEICAEIGRTILNKNGSAVDAGIAMIFCQGVVEPYNSGLGGGFLMLIYIKEDKKVFTLDAREAATFGLSVDMIKDCNRKGWRTIATPGEGLGLWEAWKRYGKLSWQILLEPSINLASNGFPFSKTMLRFLNLHKHTIVTSSSLLEIFLNPKTKEFYEEGENYVNLKLSQLLHNISTKGMNLFYHGEIAAEIGKQSCANKGVINKKNFEEYRVKWSNTLETILEDSKNTAFTLHVPPLPSYAIMTLMILNIVEGYYQEKNLHLEVLSTEQELTYHQIVESMKQTFAEKITLEDKISLSGNIIYFLLNKHWGLKMREQLNLTHTGFPDSLIKIKTIPEVHSDNPEIEKILELNSVNIYGSTNVIALASNGDAIVACSSLNDPFGSGIVINGFVLNNNMVSYLDKVEGKDGHYYNRITTQLVYNNRSTTFHSPMMVLDEEDELKLVLSAYGDSRIITSMSLVLMNYFFENYTLKQSVMKFRYHHELTSGVLIYEGPSIMYELENLIKYGHEVKMINVTAPWPWILVVAKEDDDIVTVGDPRRI